MKIDWEELKKPNIYGSVGQFVGMVIGILVAIGLIETSPFLKIIVLAGLLVWTVGTISWWNERLLRG